MMSPKPARFSTRWRFAVFIALIVFLLGIVGFRTLMNERAAAPLPKTIEEYRAALKQPDFGMYFLDFSHALRAPGGISTMEDAKLHLYEILGRRSSSMGSTESIGNLVANYSAVARKRVSFGRRWREVTNSISYDDSKRRTRRETLQLIEAILRTNGGFIFSLNATNVVLLTEKDLEELGHPVPFKP